MVNQDYSSYNGDNFNGVEQSSDINVIPVSASCRTINPNLLINDGFELQTQAIIPSSEITGSFDPEGNVVEFFIYSPEKRVIGRNYKFTDWGITENSEINNLTGSYTDAETGVNVVNDNPPTSSLTNTITLNPANNIYSEGFDTGKLYAVYNFINYELGSNIENTFYISEISGDRTEIALKSNVISSSQIKDGFVSLTDKLSNSNNFDEFYISFFNNEYQIAVNIILKDEEENSISVLIKLYEPLPPQYNLQDELYVTTKVGETEAYEVEFIEDIEGFIDNANYIKGPNINIELQDLVNNSTLLSSYEDLTNTQSSSSLDSVLNVLNQRGITITPNYSYNTFNEFINFSSAKQRINNFYEKVSQIQAYEADIESIQTITGPTGTAVSQSLASLQTNITNLIENFDGYENYLYYNSSSFAYPKTGSAYPYTLLDTGSVEVLNWMGSDVESSQYYGGYILSASLYDENNQNWLYYTIPTFITENSNNDEYTTFSNMVGQSFDEVWLYTKALSERYNTDNDPDRGLPLGLAADAIKGLGFETFGNNYDNQNNFIGLTGEDNGSYVPPTGSELITNYIAINDGEIINYWDLGYSWYDYVEQILLPGFPYAIDKVSKEIYKRLYHNMAYLTKKKGTISGLRQLINIWGIPNTILRINEFGGKNRDNTDDYDLWYNRYSYAYTPVATQFVASSSVKVPWMPLERNYIAENQKFIVPDGVALRFKTTGFPSSSYMGEFYSQSIAVKKSNGINDTQFDWGIGLYYEDQPSGSYSGSSNSDYYEYGKLRFFISGSDADGGTVISDDIYLPFFNKGWWTVLLQRNQHISASEVTTVNNPICYTLYAANKQYNGADGNVIGWEGSASICVNLTASSGGGYGNGNYGSTNYGTTPTYFSSSLIESWNNTGVTSWDGVYVGGFVSGSNVGLNVLNENAKIFSGSFQEFRYYSNDIPVTVFNDLVMNPESVEGNNISGSESSFDIVNFRAPLGNELENLYTSSGSDLYVTDISSSHPAITGSAPSVFTQSFINPDDLSTTSSYEWIVYDNASVRTYSKPNTEVYFLDQPSIGIRNRVSNKIQIDDNEDYGFVLSKEKSIDQNYLVSQSYTEDITSLEVGFSPQDEVNDDIIATYGYGVISDTLADPRFAYEGTQTYYPKLRAIAEDYFKKYTTGDVWDYLRLIKYFDNSLFKAIKSYVPARTSVTTGVIIKQNMLERNRRVPVTVNPNTTIAYTPETGSIVGGQSTSTGINSPISYRDLELTGSIDVVEIEGGAAGVPNPYNITHSQQAQFTFTQSLQITIDENEYTNLFDNASGATINTHPSIFEDKSLEFFNPVRTRFNLSIKDSSGMLEPDISLNFLISSSVRGIVGIETITSQSLTPLNTIYSTSYYEFTPQETINFYLKVKPGSTPSSTDINNLVLELNTTDFGNNVARYTSSFHNTFTSQSYIVRNETISGSIFEIQSTQDEFYNGEYSGSTVIATTQSLLNNPYAPSQVADTTYVMTVTGSSGLTSFPSYSVFLTYSFWEAGREDEARDYIENFSTNPLTAGYGQKTASLVLMQSIDPQNFFVVGAVLPIGGTDNFATPGSQISAEFPELVDVQLENPQPWISGNPYDSDNIVGGVFNQINTIGPYFKMLSRNDSILPNVNGLKPDTTNYPAMTIENSGLLGMLNSGIIVSTYLGGSDIVEKYTGPLASNGNNPVSYVAFYYKSPSLNDGRPIRFSTPIDLQTQGDPLLPGEITLVLGDYQNQYENAVDNFKKLQLGDGSGSITLVGTTWTGSGADFGTFTPAVIGFAENSIDTITKEIVNNRSTLESQPQYSLFLNNTSGQEALPTFQGLSGSYFTSSLQTPNGVLSTPSRDVIGFAYDISKGIPFSGSDSSTGIGNMFSASIKQFSQFIPFNPTLPDETDFYNSPFNPLINNATSSVLNTYVERVEYDNGSNIPSNIIPIISGSAFKASIPDSFYTQKSSINPRFMGSTLKSANYNTYTSASNIIPLNAISGSSNLPIAWAGDESYGNQAAINSNPIYFAHFKSSYNNQQLGGTATFTIDSLILSPQDNIQGNKAPITPVVVKIDGSNESLTEVKSTFELDRKVQIARRNLRFGGVNYGKTAKLKNQSILISEEEIFQGALEMETVGATTTGVYGTGSNKFPNSTNTLSFKKGDWFAWQTGSAIVGGVDFADTINVEPSQSYNLAARAQYGWLATGSASGNNNGYFILQGEEIQVSQSIFYKTEDGQTVNWSAPALALVNTINYNVYTQTSNYIFPVQINGNPGPNAVYYPGIPIATPQDNTSNTPNDVPQNYCYQNYAPTNLFGFKESLEPIPFMLLDGDEIEITYNVSTKQGGYAQDLGSWETATFIVTGRTGVVGWDVSIPGANLAVTCSITTDAGSQKSDNNVSNVNYWNKIYVYPDPSNYEIADGQVNGFIVRRRVNNDSKVIVYSTPPEGAESAATGSGEGFLIPVDFTPQQKRNALTLINQLTAKNAFKADPDNKLIE